MNAQVLQGSETDVFPMNFPNKAKEFLQQLDYIYVACSRDDIPWNTEVLIDSINLNIYNLVDKQDLKRTALRKVQQLSLANIIIEYLSVPREHNHRLALFNAIFYSSNFQHGDVPLQILELVASLAVSFKNLEILEILELWMSAIGLENPSVVSVALHLSNDFVTDEFPEKYDYLPQSANRFTAVLLMAIGKAYKNTSPPKQLIIQVANWIESTPRVCLIPLLSSLFDLFRWGIQIETFQENRLDKSKLHLALISAIKKAGRGNQLQVLPEICKLIQELRIKRESMEAISYNEELLTGATLEKVVDLLLQLIQMLISVECLDLNGIRVIFDKMEGSLLPRTEFYKLMKMHHLKPLFYTFREPKQST